MTSRYKVGDRVELNAVYLNPHKGTVFEVHAFEDGSPTEYSVVLDQRELTRFFAKELSPENPRPVSLGAVLQAYVSHGVLDALREADDG